MNYGKKKAAKRQKQITSKSAMQANRRCCRWRTICEKDY